MASCEVAGEVLVAEDDKHCASGMGDEGHASFDEDVGACLEAPRFRARR
jgi:hypothetical protein